MLHGADGAHSSDGLEGATLVEDRLAGALVEACEREMSTAMSRGWGDMDGSIYLTVQEERAGVKLRPFDTL